MVMSLLGFLRDHLEQVIQEGCERSFSSTLAFDYDKAVWDGVTPPRHNVLVIAVGTRGDIDPLIEIGKKLEALHHHTVVFASHEKHRAHIAKGCGGSNMKFVPLAGDPEVLSRFACQWSQYTSLADNLEILESHAVHMRELLQSQWQAAIHDSGHIPDVILSNPVSFMHAHLAESIGCSLHVAFPQPWIPTEAFPHPLFADQVCALPRLLLLPLGGEQKTRSKGVIDVAKMNLLSHSITDRLLWQGLEPHINDLRVGKLGLRPARIGEGHWSILHRKKVPFSGLFSGTLLHPVPEDWGSHVHVCGSVRASCSDGNGGATSAAADATAAHTPSSLALDAFFAAGHAPVYVGFGSMATDNTTMIHTLRLLLEGAAICNVRVLVQLQSWHGISEAQFAEFVTQAAHTAHLVRLAAEVTESRKRNEVWFACVVQQAINRIMYPKAAASAAATGPTHDSCSAPLGNSNGSNGNNGENYQPCAPAFLSDRRGLNWAASSAHLLLGSYEHSLLFPRLAALIHHGGAGTTVAGLRAGLPTWILPFFGDQGMWGAAVNRHGAGPLPVVPKKLTMAIAADAFQCLLTPASQAAAAALKIALDEEDGACAAAAHFSRSLPLHTSLCPLSILLGEYSLAQVHCPACDLNMTHEAFERSHERGGEDMQRHCAAPVAVSEWLADDPQSLVEGINVGTMGLARSLAGGVFSSVVRPVKGAADGGLYGAMRGALSGCSSLLEATKEGSSIFVSKIQQGLHNGGGGGSSSSSSIEGRQRGQDTLRFCYRGGGEGARLKFESVLATHCCDEQRQGRLYRNDKGDGDGDGAKDAMYRERTEAFSAALAATKALQGFMLSVRAASRERVHGEYEHDNYHADILKDPSYAYCLHPGELAAQVDALLKLDQVHSVSSLSDTDHHGSSAGNDGWDDRWPPSRCWASSDTDSVCTVPSSSYHGGSSTLSASTISSLSVSTAPSEDGGDGDGGSPCLVQSPPDSVRNLSIDIRSLLCRGRDRVHINDLAMLVSRVPAATAATSQNG